MAYNNMFGLMLMIPSIITLVIMIPLGGLLLWLTGLLFSVRQNSYGKGVLVTTIVLVAQFLTTIAVGLLPVGPIPKLVTWIVSYLIIGFLIAWLLIRHVFKLPDGKSFLVWLVWTVMRFIVSFLVNMLVMFFTFMIGLAAFSANPTF